MAEWRGRGFVSDSDDEDDIDSQETQPEVLQGGKDQVGGSSGACNVARASFAGHGVTVSQDLEEGAQLEGDCIFGEGASTASELGEPGDGDRSSPARARTEPELRIRVPGSHGEIAPLDGSGLHTSSTLDSLLSSPLSDPPSSPPTVVTDSEEHPELVGDASQGGSLPGIYLPPGEDNRHDSEEIDRHRHSVPSPTFTGIFQHSLRRRNAIQLHPYMVESELYRQTLKNRGLKPLRITPEQKGSEVSTGADTDDEEFQAEEDSLPPDDGHGSQITRSPVSRPSAGEGLAVVIHTSSRSDRRVPSSDGHIGEDLPDVDVLFARTPKDVGQRESKRRKTAHHAKRANDQTSITAAVQSAKATMEPSTAGDTAKWFDVLSSPVRPRARGEKNGQFPSGFQVPRGLSPPTATVTSQVSEGAEIADDAVISEDSEDDIATPARSVGLSISRSRSSSSQSGDEETAQVAAVRREIKGVLPASWLKLDRRQMLPKAAPLKVLNPRPIFSDGQILRPGVARKPTTSTRGPTKPTNLTASLTDDLEYGSREQDSGDDEAISPATSPFARGHDRISGTVFEVEEDNRIDNMLPPRPRVYSHRTAGTRRHRDPLQETDRPAKRHRPNPSIFGGSKSSRMRQPRIDKMSSSVGRRTASKSKQPKPHAPNLSILNAPLSQSSQNHSTPQFLRVAKRQARSRPRKGRDSPTQKTLRLATRQDTEDVQSVLNDWRRGVMRPRTHDERSVMDSARQPLSELSRNAVVPLPTGAKIQPARAEADNTHNVSALRSRPLNPVMKTWLLADFRKQMKPQLSSGPPESGTARLKVTLDSISKPRARPWKPPSTTIRAAQLESTSTRYREGNVQFQRYLASANRLYEEQLMRTKGGETPLIRRFLDANDTVPPQDPQPKSVTAAQRDPAQAIVSPGVKPIRRPRKRPPRHVNADALEYRQPTERETIALEQSLDYVIEHELPEIGLHGLGSFGATYMSADRLDPGTTLGGGAFSKGFDRESCDDPANWELPKRHALRLFGIFDANSSNRQSHSFNAYCRGLFSRCHHLIKTWEWSRCESIVGTLFDFFAANKLAHLRNEESHGSPLFLERLDMEQSLDVEPNDRCFHILLKIIGVGLRALRRVYTEKTIRNIVFRLTPNHDRRHPKEESIRREDLESLRNHHDLLCTLYWASPASCRPSLSILRGLVHAGSSHREACHISIKSWSNLVRFQLSTNEPSAALEEFGAWHSDMMTQLLNERIHARTEAQAQSTYAMSGGRWTIPVERVESTIEQNERQVEGTLGDALSSMVVAMRSANSNAIKALLNKASTADVFELFDPRKQRTNRVVSLALEIIRECVRTLEGTTGQQVPQQASEESQDYGEWPAFEEAADVDSKQEPLEHFHLTVHEGLTRLVSNAFGADTQPDDSILTEIIDTWVLTASLLVRHGSKQWDNYVGAHQRESWSSLRNTVQARRFTTYFLSKCIQRDPSCFEAHKTFFLSCWVSSLVEIRSMLTFHHLLTSALLNADRAHPLLHNLPFCRRGQTCDFKITNAEYCERRLSLISSVLANMRTSLERIDVPSHGVVSQLRRDYASLLKQIMSSMKSNFQGLPHDSTERAVYTEFVHSAIELLQQHTADIVPVDRFFTDAIAFPVPAADPSYVVGRLRNYGLRLSSTSTRIYRHLVDFLQSISEEAAVHDRQDLLVHQIQAAVSDTFEDGDSKRPSLRAFLLQAIFPAYIEAAFRMSTGWILARPILLVTTRMLDDLMQDVDATQEASLGSAMSIIASTLSGFRQAIAIAVERPDLPNEPHILYTLSLLYEATAATLPTVDYLHRTAVIASASRPPSSIDEAHQHITFFRHLARFIAHRIIGDDDDGVTTVRSRLLHLPAPDTQPLFEDAQALARTELALTVDTHWVRRDDKYYVERGTTRQEIQAACSILRGVEGEQERVLRAIDEYERLCGRFASLDEEECGGG